MSSGGLRKVPCAVCRRDKRKPKQLSELTPWLQGYLLHTGRACSLVCLTLISLRENPLVDPTHNELAAIEHAGMMAGEYLDSLGRTDLASLEVNEWLTFLEVVVTAFSDRLRDFERQEAQKKIDVPIDAE
jgi:hypothetical protein